MKKLLPLFLTYLAFIANMILFDPEIHAQARWWPKFSLFKIHACTNPPKITCPPAFVACPELLLYRIIQVLQLVNPVGQDAINLLSPILT